MADYPLATFGLDSSIAPEEGIDDDTSQSGVQHSRVFYTGYYQFTLVHHLTRAEFNTLFAFYAANSRAAVNLTYFAASPSAPYTVKFTSAPTITENYGLNRHRVEVSMRGYK